MSKGFIKHIAIIIVALFVLSLIGINFVEILQSSGVEGQADGSLADILNVFEIIFDPIELWISNLVDVIKDIVVN